MSVLSYLDLTSLPQLTADEAEVLRIVVWRGGIRLRSIGDSLKMPANRLRTACSRLERLGYVYRVPARSDKRERVILPTERGTQAGKFIISRSANTSRELLAGLDPEKRAAVLEAAQILTARGLEMMRDAEAPGVQTGPKSPNVRGTFSLRRGPAAPPFSGRPN